MTRWKFSRQLFFIILILSLPLFVSCAGTGRQLSTYPLSTLDQMEGTYRLILYGGQYTDDIETIAILDLEGDDYTINPYGAIFQYQVKTSTSGRDALEEAEDYFRSVFTSYKNYEVRIISDPEGSIIGYEVRPMHLSFVYGASDLLNISHSLQEKKEVIVYVRKKDRFERLLPLRHNH